MEFHPRSGGMEVLHYTASSMNSSSTAGNRASYCKIFETQSSSPCARTREKDLTSVRRRSSRVDFRLRNPSSPDVVFVMKALFSILDPQNRVETNTCFVFAHDFVLGVRYCFFFFVAYLYYRLHKIFAMPPFQG